MSCHVKESRYLMAKVRNDMVFKGRSRNACLVMIFLYPVACHVMSSNIHNWKLQKRMIWFWGADIEVYALTWHFYAPKHVMPCQEYRILKAWRRKEYDLWSSEGPMLKYMNISMPLACHVMPRNIDIWNLKKGMIWSTMFWGANVKLYGLTWHFYAL